MKITQYLATGILLLGVVGPALIGTSLAVYRLGKTTA